MANEPSRKARLLTATWPRRWSSRFGMLLGLYLLVFVVFVLPLGYFGFLGRFLIELPVGISLVAAAIHAAFVKPGRNVWTNRDPIIDDAPGSPWGPTDDRRAQFWRPR